MVESNPEVRSTRTRLVSLAYLAVVGFAVSFAVIWFVGALVEAHGPSSTSRGRVLSRDVEEYQARVCRSGSSRFCSYEDRERHTVIGERDDGSTWLVTSEGAYDAVRSGDLVVVSTSTLTDRVVAIENLDDGLRRDDWRFAGSEQYFVIIGVSVVVLGGAVHLHRDVHQTEGDRAFPDGTHDVSMPSVGTPIRQTAQTAGTLSGFKPTGTSGSGPGALST